MFGQLLATEITDPWQLSRQFLGFITMVLKQSKTQSILAYNHGKKNLINQIRDHIGNRQSWSVLS
jgi:hypothetical protein